MNTKSTRYIYRRVCICTACLLLIFGFTNSSAKAKKESPCPPLGWSEGLVAYLQPTANIPTTEPKSDCEFHEWSWEAFVWATALDSSGTPRFMTFKTSDELTTNSTGSASARKTLRLATRTHVTTSTSEGAGAIVEADGNMLVASNGYPVYASVHFNDAYYKTAKNNLIINGDYQKNSGDYFAVGAAVFKATWLRLDKGEDAPAGAFTTMAEVPVLAIVNNNVVPAKNSDGSIKTTSAMVALVGLHVVGITNGHPEFLWGTFEHKLNVPMTPDNTFSTSGSSNTDYTFYKAGTSFADVNIANTQPSPASKQTPILSFNEATQKFSPRTNAVQENVTGGENNSPNGPRNIGNLNTSSQGFLSNLNCGEKTPYDCKGEHVFANYQLIGTVWMKPNTYVRKTANWQNLNQVNGVGSVNLANSTAETFQQVVKNTPAKDVQNCFLCHNPQSFTFGNPPLLPRRIAISHVIATGSIQYEVPNSMNLCWDVSAGPIWNNGDAQAKCPKVCGKSKWNGQWTTTKAGVESVCGCCNE